MAHSVISPHFHHLPLRLTSAITANASARRKMFKNNLILVPPGTSTIGSYLGLSGLPVAVWLYLALSQAIWGYLGRSVVISGDLGLSGAIASIWSYLGLSGSISGDLGLSKPISGDLGQSGAIWVYLG